MYLGMKLESMQLHNDIWAWSMSSSKYVQEAVKIYKEYVARHLSKDCQRGQIIHLRVVIPPNWMCPQYWEQMRHLITSP